MIHAKDLTCGYDDLVVLTVPELELTQGGITGLLGRNGCGKSTLLRSLAGLIPCRGQVEVDGLDLHKLSHQERARHVAFLPQSLSVPDMTVRTLVGHGRYARMGRSKVLSQEDLAQVQAAMATIGIEELADRPLAQLSGGQRQLAYLAMVVAQDAPMLLLDEPGTYLDLEHQLELAALLRQVARDGRGVVVATHDVASAFSTCDRLVLLGEGRMMAQGTPEELAEVPDLVRACLGLTVAPVDLPGAAYRYIPMM